MRRKKRQRDRPAVRDYDIQASHSVLKTYQWSDLERLCQQHPDLGGQHYIAWDDYENGRGQAQALTFLLAVPLIAVLYRDQKGVKVVSFLGMEEVRESRFREHIESCADLANNGIPIGHYRANKRVV